MDDKKQLQSYFNNGEMWDKDIIALYRRIARISIFGSIFCIAISFFCLFLLGSLIPLKSFEPYIVEVDKNTGYIEVKSGLTNVSDLTDQEAVTQANIVRYIRARESYDYLRVKENVDLAALLSADEAADQLQTLYSDANNKNPVKIYGKNTTITTNIKSVSFPNNSTAIVRFSTDITGNSQVHSQEHYVAVLRFRYTNTPMKNEWRFDNPLGFQVTSYHRDQETISDGKRQ